jgi:hypothetical protein
MTLTPLVACGEVVNELEKKDFKFDVRPLFLFQHLNPLWQIYLKHLDIVTFSIYEDSDEPGFLYATMDLRDFRYSERLSVYVIYWTYECTHYYAITHIHTGGEAISIKAGYFDISGTAHSTPINGDINEEESTLTWFVPKDIIGNPEAGDEFTDIHANTFLVLQKGCEMKFPIYLAKDIARPLIRAGYTYSL